MTAQDLYDQLDQLGAVDLVVRLGRTIPAEWRKVAKAREPELVDLLAREHVQRIQDAASAKVMEDLQAMFSGPEHDALMRDLEVLTLARFDLGGLDKK